MNTQEIIARAVQKAWGNGWTEARGGSPVDWILNQPNIPILIFNHDFAKALWGRLNVPRYGEDKYPYADDQLMPVWQFHLQQMVIADDPIKYLGEHLS